MDILVARDISGYYSSRTVRKAIRFNIADLDTAKMAAKMYRKLGHKCRLVYRGPRNVRWTSSYQYENGSYYKQMCTFTHKANAVAVDLYVTISV